MNQVKENLLAAFRYLLKPLARLAIKNAVGFPDFAEALKRAYVDVAIKRLADSGKEPSEEGISLITGVDTQEVRKVLDEKSSLGFQQSIQGSNPFARLLSAWHSDNHYTGPYGVVRDLPFNELAARTEATANKQAWRSGPTFTALAQQYCKEISPEVLLEELLLTKCVQEVGTGVYRAVERSYIPEPLSSSSIMLVARGVHNLCETFERNLRPESSGGRGLIERNIYTRHKVSEVAQKEFDVFIRKLGQMFANDVDNYLNEVDKPGCEFGSRVGVNFHHYVVNEDDEVALSKELPKTEG
jgi:hypothetical protein